MSDQDAALLDAVKGVRQGHNPNEYDSCVMCRHTWPCDADMLAELVMTRLDLAITEPGSAAVPEPTDPAPAGLDADEMRKQRGWPTPNHMRRAADALDILTPARYGDVLRWFADLCDAIPGADR